MNEPRFPLSQRQLLHVTIPCGISLAGLAVFLWRFMFCDTVYYYLCLSVAFVPLVYCLGFTRGATVCMKAVESHMEEEDLTWDDLKG